MGYRETAIVDEIVGIIQPKKFLVDIGAGGLAGGNSWKLISVNSWRGLLIEPKDERATEIGNLLREHRFTKRVKLLQEWIMPNTINEIVTGEIGFLSIDIDGQDYHVWKALKCRPQIIVIEYNPLRYGELSVMKRKDIYDWKTDEIEGRLSYGSSKEALISLGRSKGYELVNFTDYNLFFVRK